MRILSFVTAALLAVSLYFVSAPVHAIENGDPFSTGDSNGPHQPSGQTAYDYGTHYTTKPVAVDTWNKDDLVPFGSTASVPTGTASVVSPQRTAEEVSSQNAANEAWRWEAYRRAQQDRRAGNLSVYYAAQDWNGAVGGGKSPDPYGGPVGASIGGSD